MTTSVVNVRGYNTDYIVPMSGMSNSKSIYSARHPMWNKEGSPSRRTSTKMSPLAVTSANGVSRSVSTSSPSSNSSSPSSKGRQGFSQDYSRKYPPEFSAIQRQLDFASTEGLPSTYKKDNVEIDHDVMRYMSKKYSEPRFTNGTRKNPPPPYSSAHTTVSPVNGMFGSRYIKPNCRGRKCNTKKTSQRRSAF